MGGNRLDDLRSSASRSPTAGKNTVRVCSNFISNCIIDEDDAHAEVISICTNSVGRSGVSGCVTSLYLSFTSVRAIISVFQCCNNRVILKGQYDAKST